MPCSSTEGVDASPRRVRSPFRWPTTLRLSSAGTTPPSGTDRPFCHTAVSGCPQLVVKMTTDLTSLGFADCMYTAASTLMHALKARDATKGPSANDTLIAENCSWLVERLTSAAASTPGMFYSIIKAFRLRKVLNLRPASICSSARPTAGRSEGTPEQHREATHPLPGQHPLPVLFLDRPSNSTPASVKKHLEQLSPS